MEIRLDYGRTGLDVHLPDDLAVSVLEPPKGMPLADPSAAVAAALAQPIGTRRSPSWRAAGATRWS